MKIKWQKATPELTAFFEKGMAGVKCERRKMFGYPCCFINNNMFAGVFKDLIILRRSEKDRAQTMAKFEEATSFEPIKGRVMKEYVALPEELYCDQNIFNALIDKSVRYVLTLPRKERKK